MTDRGDSKYWNKTYQALILWGETNYKWHDDVEVGAPAAVNY